MPCACGHPQSDHTSISMSVTLKSDKPPPPPQAYEWAIYRCPNATYDRDECHCGCTIYDEDSGDP
jgi:hypothetical protein